MARFRVSVSSDDDVVFDQSVEAHDWNEATRGVLEEFKSKPEAADSTTWDVHVEIETSDA